MSPQWTRGSKKAPKAKGREQTRLGLRKEELRGIAREDLMGKLSEESYDLSALTRQIHMKLQPNIYTATALVVLAVTGSMLRAGAGDKTAAVDPTGIWKVSYPSRDKTAGFEPTLILKLKGDKLSGTISRAAGRKIEKLPLEDAKLKGNEISFATTAFALTYIDKVLQPTDTNKVTHAIFQGTISGDIIKGKVKKESWNPEFNRTQDWEARRIKTPAE